MSIYILYMDILFKHRQEKREKKSNKNKSTCDIEIRGDKKFLEYNGYFYTEFNAFNKKKSITFHHGFILDIVTGDIHLSYKINNHNLTDEKLFRDLIKNKKNNFRQLEDLTESGLLKGERKHKYWGVKYEKATDKIFEIIYNKLKENFKSDFYKNKIYKEKYSVNPFYDLIIDYHLDCKNIKPHDGVYFDIQNSYPKTKWLKKNDYKFLPAVLDELGIKSKYIISELNTTKQQVQISSLKFLCNLFGDNYMDYIKKIDWKKNCFEISPNKKGHVLKNEFEKNNMVRLINNWEKISMMNETLIYSINKILNTRLFLETKGINLRFTAKNDLEFENLLSQWSSVRRHYNRGYKVRYDLPIDFVKMIEEEIIVNNLSFKPKLIISEEEFALEGIKMKNCMSNQFVHGAIYLYVSLEHKRKRINLQYRKGLLIQSYGKANTAVDDIFQEPIKVLTERFLKNPEIMWKREKYDILK